MLHPEKLKGKAWLFAIGMTALIVACGITAALAVQDPLLAVRQKDISSEPTVQTIPAAQTTAEPPADEPIPSTAQTSAVWFTPADIQNITAAELVWWDGTVYPADVNAIEALTTAFASARTMKDITGCPFYSVLYLHRADGVCGKIMPAEDGCSVFVSDGIGYDYGSHTDDNSNDSGALFHDAFGTRLDALPFYTSGAVKDTRPVYSSETCHYAVALPESWAEKYTVVENGSETLFFHREIYNKNDPAMTGFLCALIYDSTMPIELKDIPADRLYLYEKLYPERTKEQKPLAKEDDNVLYIRYASAPVGAIDENDTDAMEYRAMVQDILQLSNSDVVFYEMTNAPKKEYPVPMGMAAEQTLLWPVANVNAVSQTFGANSKPGSETETFHNGIDIPADVGTPVLAAADGIIIETGFDTDDGNYIRLAHGGGAVTVYAHCQEILCKQGDTLHKGDVIATVGNTGRATGSHLCFQVWQDGVPENPLSVTENSGVHWV